MQTSTSSLLASYFNNNHMSLDSQRILLYHDIHHVNVENEIKYKPNENLKVVIFNIFF